MHNLGAHHSPKSWLDNHSQVISHQPRGSSPSYHAEVPTKSCFSLPDITKLQTFLQGIKRGTLVLTASYDDPATK